MNKCLGCGCIAHCGSSCTECYECSDCECVNCMPPTIQIDDEGYPYPTGDD